MPGRWAAISAAFRRKRAALRDLLTEIHAATGRKVSIVGWSLGGVYARDLALQAPDMVRSVITLGSPFANDITGDQRDAALRSAVGRGRRRQPGDPGRDRRRPAGSGDLDLFAHRRHRELAHQPAAPLRLPPKISRCISPAISASASIRPPCGRSPTAWRSPRANSSNLTDRGRLPLHMRPRKMHNPDQCPGNRGPSERQKRHQGAA